jgi:hypothetical protein
MARSQRRTPICGITTARSEKLDKVEAHRRERRLVSETLVANPEAAVIPHERETSDPWTMAKDGKVRFDPVRLFRLMRK